MYFKQIDSFRFFAAFMVIMSHWLHEVPVISELRLGGIGVDFFFIISGFLITKQLLEIKLKTVSSFSTTKRAYLSFFTKRFFRIVPLYLVILIVSTSLNKDSMGSAFFYNLFYISNFYFIEIQQWSNIYSHFWSLSVEEHFYLIWPLIIFGFSFKKLVPSMMLISITALAFRFYLLTQNHDYFAVRIHTIACLDLFMFGGVLAYSFVKYPVLFKAFFNSKLSKIAIISLLAVLYFTHVNSQNELFSWVYFRFLFAILGTLLLGTIVIGYKGIVGNILENKWLRFGGKLSYAIYLIHGFVPGMLLFLENHNLHFAVKFSFSFIVTVAISLILHLFIEQPIRNFGKRIT